MNTQPFEKRTNGCQFFKNHLKSKPKGLGHKWSGFQMVGIIAIVPPFEVGSSKRPDFKWLDFRSPLKTDTVYNTFWWIQIAASWKQSEHNFPSPQLIFLFTKIPAWPILQGIRDLEFGSPRCQSWALWTCWARREGLPPPSVQKSRDREPEDENVIYLKTS